MTPPKPIPLRRTNAKLIIVDGVTFTQWIAPYTGSNLQFWRSTCRRIEVENHTAYDTYVLRVDGGTVSSNYMWLTTAIRAGIKRMRDNDTDTLEFDVKSARAAKETYLSELITAEARLENIARILEVRGLHPNIRDLHKNSCFGYKNTSNYATPVTLPSPQTIRDSDIQAIHALASYHLKKRAGLVK